jgi:hypothetical protein
MGFTQNKKLLIPYPQPLDDVGSVSHAQILKFVYFAFGFFEYFIC